MKMLHLVYMMLLVLTLSLESGKSYAFGWYGETFTGIPCKDIGGPQGHGPFDYVEVKRTKDQSLIKVARLWEVDKIHYGKGKKELKDGLNRVSIKRAFAEFNYTIRAFPNHTLALRELVELEINRIKLNKSRGENLEAFGIPPECYLQRAIMFRPKQADLHLLYAVYLHRLNKNQEAEEYYKKAIDISPNYSEAHYNLGLLYMAAKRYSEALTHAQKAYSLKYPLNGLKLKLIDAGVWKAP